MLCLLTNWKIYAYGLGLIYTMGLLFILAWGISYLVFGKFPTFVALRYIVSKKKRNAVNLITLVSVLGISIVTTALIIILSIFNGFQMIIVDMFASFDPDIQVVLAKGRNFDLNDELLTKAEKVPGVVKVSPVIQNKAIIKYYDKQHIVEVKGIEYDYLEISPIDELIFKGSYKFRNPRGNQMAILGGGVAEIINSNMRDNLTPIELFVASEDKEFLLNPEAGLIKEPVYPSGYFSVQLEYDNKYVIVGYDLAEKLFGYKGQATGLDIKIEHIDDAAQVKADLEKALGPDFKVLTWYEQHQTLYEVMENEKFVAYLILTLVLILAGVNIVGGISMIVLEKTRDIAILKSFGMPSMTILKIFLSVGYFVGASGGIIGSALGLFICLIQVECGVFKLAGGGSFLIDAWPIRIDPPDFLIVFLTVFILALLAAVYPSIKAADTRIIQSLRK